MTAFWNAIVLAACVAACSPTLPPDTVESLAADPERLREVLARCRDGFTDMEEGSLCETAERAWRKRFLERRSRSKRDD